MDIVNLIPAQVRVLTYKSAVNMLSVITVLLPLIVLYRFQPHQSSFYGLTLKGFDTRPYFAILLIRQLKGAGGIKFLPVFRIERKNTPSGTFLS